VVDREKLQRAAMFLLIAGLIAWPPLHMGLASYFGFSSWKYFGWGMYATPYSPKNQIVQVYLLPQAPLENLTAKSESLLYPARLQMTFGVFQWRGDRFAPLVTTPLARHQSREVQRLKILRSPRDVARLARKIARDQRLSTERSRMIVFVIQPRIHPLRRTTYAEVDAFRYEHDRAEKLGTYRSDETDIEALFLSFVRQKGAPSAHGPVD